ncbi:MAG: glycerophosphodiester phosphodiesterase family protein [Anaerolineales bacterium]
MSRFFHSLFTRFLPWVTLTHALAFILFWLTNSLFYTSTNDYLADMLGMHADYVSLLIGASTLMAVWSLVRGILSLPSRVHKPATVFTWIYSIISFIYVAFFYGSFWLLFRESPVQLVRIGHLIGYFRLILDALLLLGLALLVAFLLRSIFKKNLQAGERLNWPALILLLVTYGVLWGLPLVIPPGSVVRGKLPDKPLIIAHRGASMLAPENTHISAELAASLGVYGLETDIQVSQDGGLFLMHDDTLDRTTNVASVFPGRQAQPAGDFTLAEISQLNAGTWFVEQDPFHAIRNGLVTPEQVAEYRQQGVPLLSDWLEVVRTHQLSFIFDLKPLPEGHPYAASFFELAFDQIHQAGIDRQVWFLVDPEQLQAVHNLAPQMIRAYGADYQSPPTLADLTGAGYQLVNVEYGIGPQWIAEYQSANLWVNIYTVDEPWQFSRLWLLNADSLTTSNAGVMSSLERPIFSLPYRQYLLLWGVAGLVGLALIGGLVYPLVRQRPPFS